MRKSILFMLGIFLFLMIVCFNGDKKEVKLKVFFFIVIFVNKELFGNMKKNELNLIIKMFNVVFFIFVEKI